MDTSTRNREVGKLRKMGWSSEKTAQEFRTNPAQFAQIGNNLDINLDTVLNFISSGKVPMLAYIIDDLGLQMNDKPYQASSKMGECGGVGTAKDIAVGAYFQRLYTVGNRFPDHPMVAAFSLKRTNPTKAELAAFTLSDIPAASTWNPFETLPTREGERIQPELHYTELLAESWSTLEDTERLPLYHDRKRDRELKRVTELGQIEVEQFQFTEDAKAIFKYGVGIQWSYETAFKEIRMQLLGFWIMRRSIEQQTLFLMDLAATAIDFAGEKGRTYTVPADSGDSNQWTIPKLDAYNERWRVPYMWNFMICTPAAKTKFKMQNYGSDSWTLGHFNMANPGQAEYQDARSMMPKRYISIPNLKGYNRSPEKTYGENDYLFLDTMNAIGQVYNTGMARDETQTVMGNQSYVRYFTIGNRFYPIIEKAVEEATLA